MKKFIFLICLFCTSLVSAQDNSQVRVKYNQAIQLSLHKETLSEAVKLLDEVIAKDRNYQDAFYTKAMILDDLGQKKKALVAARQIKNTCNVREIPSAYLTEGLFEERYGNQKAAKNCYEKALQLAKDELAKNYSIANLRFYLFIKYHVTQQEVTQNEIKDLLPQSLPKDEAADMIQKLHAGINQKALLDASNIIRNGEDFLEFRTKFY